MRTLLLAFAFCAAVLAAAEPAFPAPAPHWFRNARIIKFYFDPKKPFSEAELDRQMAELKANGVTVIELNNTSFQFVPGLSQPDKAQWKQQVNYATDEPLCRIAKKHGMRTLKEDGDLKVKLQLTTESEVTRVCKLDIASD